MSSSQKINIEESQNLIPEQESKKTSSRKEGELAIDCYETPSDFVVLSAIAGVKIGDLDISIENNILIIKGFRETPEKEENKKSFLNECYWGSFSRKIVLSEDVDIARAEALFQKGILKIKIPRIKRIKEKKLKVKNA